VNDNALTSDHRPLLSGQDEMFSGDGDYKGHSSSRLLNHESSDSHDADVTEQSEQR